MGCARALSLLLALLLAPPFAGAQDLGDGLHRQSSTIRGSLESIREQSRILSEELETLQGRLTASEEERTALREKSMELSSSLTSINEQLTASYANIERLETRLSESRRAAAALLAVLAVRLALMVAGYVLYAKGVRLPRWLDILL